jgi:hypothetical protein
MRKWREHSQRNVCSTGCAGVLAGTLLAMPVNAAR